MKSEYFAKSPDSHDVILCFPTVISTNGRDLQCSTGVKDSSHAFGMTKTRAGKCFFGEDYSQSKPKGSINMSTQLLVFIIDEKRYAIHLQAVKRAIPTVEITPLPELSITHISGVQRKYG